MRRGKFFAIASVALLFLEAIQAGAFAGNGTPYVVYHNAVKRITIELNLINTNDTAITDMHIYYGVPISLPEQKILELQWFPQPTQYVHDIFNQEIADFYIERLEPGGSISINTDIIGLFGIIKYNIEPDNVGKLNDIPREILDLYTANGPFYNIANPFIINTANSVVGKERNPYLMAVRIHDFVAKTVKYELAGGWDDAVTVLKRGRGSCSEISFAFIALARAVGLPARFAGGSYCPQNLIMGRYVDNTFHRWVEVYIPNYGWVPFDATLDSPLLEGNPSHEYVGSHAYALIMIRGGGTDDRYMGVYYPFNVKCSDPSQLDRLDGTLKAVWKNY